MSSELPGGWAETTLGELLREPLRNGHSARASADGSGVRTLTLSAVTYGDFSEKNTKVTIADPAKIGDLWLEPGDLLIERSNTPELVGTARLYAGPRDFAIFPDLVIRIRLNGVLALPRFIELWLQNDSMRTYLTDGAQGTAGSMPKIDQGIVLGVPVLLPPLPEQRRIVAKVDALLAQVNAARERLAKVPLILKRFRQAVLVAACSGKLTEDWRGGTVQQQPASLHAEIECERRARWEAYCRAVGRRRKYPDPVAFDADELPDIPEEWTWASADEVCSQVTDGEHVQPPYQSTGRPMLTATHIRDGWVEFSNYGRISEEAFQACIKRCAPAEDDILIVSVGATTGRAAIVQKCPPFAIVRSVLLLRPLMDARFLLRWVQSPWCFNWMTRASGASAQPHFYIGDAKRMPVPLPSVAEQREIAARVDALFGVATVVERRLAIAMQRSEALPQAVLSRAFSGELVPTEAALARAEGREYEPASALLERIRAERSASPAADGRRQRPRLRSVPAGQPVRSTPTRTLRHDSTTRSRRS